MKFLIHSCVFCIELLILIAGIAYSVVSQLPTRMNFVTESASELAFRFEDGQSWTNAITYGQLYYATNATARRACITFGNGNAKDGDFRLTIPKPFVQFELYFNIKNEVPLPAEIRFKKVTLDGCPINLEDQLWETNNEKIHFKCLAYKPIPVLNGYAREFFQYGVGLYFFCLACAFVYLRRMLPRP